MKLLFLIVLFWLGKPAAYGIEVDSAREANLRVYIEIFKEEGKPSFEAFHIGLNGYNKLLQQEMLKNKQVFTIIDYTQSSNVRRLWVIDLENNEVLFNTLVAHGKNSGEVFPMKFSNQPHTNMSSLGFYITGESYFGKHGLSLKLDGIEKGLNDKARQRAIVMHCADYATTEFINKYGRLGRSFGCPALPPAKNKPVIEAIKGKSCLFIYYPDELYLKKSDFVN